MVTINTLGMLSTQKYERYLPTAFDESLTLLEKVNKIIEYLNYVNIDGEKIPDLLNKMLNDIENLKNSDGNLVVTVSETQPVIDGEKQQYWYQII